MSKASYLAAALLSSFPANSSAQPPAPAQITPAESRQTFVNVDPVKKTWCRIVFNDAKTGPDTVLVTKGHLKAGQENDLNTAPGDGKEIRFTARNGMSVEEARKIGELACSVNLQAASAPATGL